MVIDLVRLFAYEAWANLETLASLRAAGTPPPRALKVMAHVVAAQRPSYHRGQIASEVRAAGREPAYTDFIHSVRQGFI